MYHCSVDGIVLMEFVRILGTRYLKWLSFSTSNIYTVICPFQAFY